MSLPSLQLRSALLAGAMLKRCISVLQNGVIGQPHRNQLASFKDSIAVAVVDRTADVRHAAREILATGVHFGGRSPYAPSIVLVNEFVKSAFLRAADELISGQQNSRPSEKRVARDEVDEAHRPLQKVDHQLKVISGYGNLALVEVECRSQIIGTKVDGPVLLVHSIKSLDDAIDLLGSDSAKPCLAAYHFANLATSNYLSRYIMAQQSFVNHVPRLLLVGPAMPLSQSSTVENRYPQELFAMHFPVLIGSTTTSGGLRPAESALSSDQAQELLNEATSPLKVFKRHPGGGVGFFEQGFLISAGLIVISALTISATGFIWLWRWSRAV